MTPNMQMEQLSLGYIRAVAADAGYQIARPEPDVDSVDGALMASFGRRPRIEFQAKATARDIVRDGHIHFPLPIDNYDDLRIDVIIPRILIVFLMPKETTQWISQTDDELLLHRCAYWMSLKGEPESSNTSSVTVRVPLTNMFNTEQLTDMMQRINARGEL